MTFVASCIRIFVCSFPFLEISKFLSFVCNSEQKKHQNLPLTIASKLRASAAMEGMVFAAFVQTMVDNLTSLLLEEISSSRGLSAKLERLSATLSAIRAVIADAERRWTYDASLRHWLQRLTDVAHDADDALDAVSFHRLRSQIEGPRKVRSCLCPRGVVFRFKMGRRIEAIEERLEEIARNRFQFGLIGPENGRLVCDWFEGAERRNAETSSLIDSSSVIGREGDVGRMMEVLLSEDPGESRAAVGVVGIVGMGGLGKTTLARLVYNDERVKLYFELRMWVYAGEDFDVRRVTRAVVESATLKSPEVSDLDPLQIRLKDIIKGKRFLLVVDDVWCENQFEWDAFRMPFDVGARGSKIIITTRSKRVVAVTCAGRPFPLQFLPDEECWSLFKSCALRGRCSGEWVGLEAIGKEIVKKCGGLPLAIRAIGSLLCLKMDEGAWEHILKSEFWDFAVDVDGVLPALRLSYHHLPAQMKQCFLHCSLYPKDYGFERDRLVQVWIAEGFVQPRGSKQMEDVGGEYFEELFLRSFFQYSHNNLEDQPIYKMHDLIHDLARFISNDYYFRVENMESSNKFEKACHLSLRLEIGGKLHFKGLSKAKKLRTFTLLDTKDFKSSTFTHQTVAVSHDLFRVLRSLRVLDLSCASIAELPSSIGNLIHLRYMDISRACVRRLPNTIAHLYNLQTLRLKNCSKLVELPKKMSSLINLRHLYLHCRLMSFDAQMISMPSRMGRLTGLRTLSLYVVGRGSNNGIKELKDMQELEGSICITKLENVLNEEDAKETNLKNKAKLCKLELQWSPSEVQHGRVKEILNGLQPHVNIRVLGIYQYDGAMIPSWVTNPSFSMLETIYLYSCRKCEILPPFGQLPSLRDLCIRGLHAVKLIGPEFCGANVAKSFPSLKILELEDMLNLERWCGFEASDFCCLQELELINCPKLKELQHLPACLKKLLIWNCKELSSLPNLPHLLDLTLIECDDLILSDVSHLASLSSLNISSFLKTKSLSEGLLKLSMLKELHIINLEVLTSIPEGVGFKDLVMLEKLVLSSCPQLASLREVELPTRLRKFEMNKLDCLLFLPEKLNSITSLKILNISYCAQLISLPEDGLPHGLQMLCISNCPCLKERCQKERGEDWSKIAHIPCIEIDGECILSC